MFIDYLTLMLINISAGLFIMALFVFRYFDSERKRTAPGFLITGFVSLLTGFHEIFTWPIPGSYNIPFGELATLFGVIFFGLGLALLLDWDLLTLGIYATFAGAASIVLGARIYDLRMTSEPLVASAGFILTGLMALLSLPVYFLRKHLLVRILASLGLLGAAAIWATIGYLAYWQHLQAFSKWVPALMAPVK
jgi:putative membrane protein